MIADLSLKFKTSVYSKMNNILTSSTAQLTSAVPVHYSSTDLFKLLMHSKLRFVICTASCTIILGNKSGPSERVSKTAKTNTFHFSSIFRIFFLSLTRSLCV